jgi:hypothetical protein
MRPQQAKLLAAQNAMHMHYVHKWQLWGLYHLQNLDRPAEYISPRQLREFTIPEFQRLMKLVRGGV